MKQKIAEESGLIRIHRAEDRGSNELGWLHARHSFSFGRYHDPERVSYRSLRVLNDDIVEPGGGFGEHGHDNMEIITWILAGALAHRDSTGNQGVIRPGDVQVMSAGSGIRHSEVNASETEPVHLLQIWIIPAVRDVEPRYGQRSMPAQGRASRWQTLASGDGREESLEIHQDAAVCIADLPGGDRLTAALESPSRFGYLHIALGAVRIGDEVLRAGDAIEFTGTTNLEIEGDADQSQVLLFDLA